jgi:hypothetical protein
MVLLKYRPEPGIYAYVRVRAIDRVEQNVFTLRGGLTGWTAHSGTELSDAWIQALVEEHLDPNRFHVYDVEMGTFLTPDEIP